MEYRGLWQPCGSNRRLPQNLIYRIAYRTIHAWQDVGVGVQGLSYGGVSKKFLDVLGVDVTAEQQRSARVPEVVEADRGGQACTPQYGPERAHDVAARKRRAYTGRTSTGTSPARATASPATSATRACRAGCASRERFSCSPGRPRSGGVFARAAFRVSLIQRSAWRKCLKSR